MSTTDRFCISIPHPLPSKGTDAYLQFLADHGRKELTVTAYRTAIRWCERHLTEAGRTTDPMRVGADDLLYLSRVPAKESTVRYNLERYNAYLQWVTNDNILARLKLQWNRPQRHRTFITKEDFKKMYELATPPQRMALVLGAYMGLRRSEIVAIDLDDIKGDSILVHGKGHGQGLVVRQYMPPAVREELDRYLTWRRQYVGDDRRDLMITLRGNKRGVNPVRLRTEPVYLWIKELAEAVGVEASPHTLRRLFCTTLYNHGKGTGGDGADLRAIITLTRHSDISVLFNCYINADPSTVKKCADNLEIL